MFADKRSVSFGLASAPVSADPLEFDAAVHHIVFRPIFATLVSVYKSGEILGVLARDWNVSSDFRVWRFNIREGMTFENGEPVTAEEIRKNFARLAFIFSKKKSNAGLFEFLEGYGSQKTAIDHLSGLRVEKNSLVLKFTRAIPTVLENISFGFYGIAHPSQFSHIDGRWKDIKSVISSGPYKITAWTADNIQLRLRTEFPPQLRVANPIMEYLLTWSKERSHLDIFEDTSDIRDVPSKFTFFGSPPSDITYVECFSWNERANPLFKKAVRTIFRDQFLEELVSLGFPTSRSFLPLSISDITPAKDSEPPPARDIGKGFEITARSPEYKSPLFSTAFKPALEAAAKKLGFRVKWRALSFDVFWKLLRTSTSIGLDFAPRGTGILIDHPSEGIRFMFESKDGIRLPDTDGRISRELQNEPFSARIINDLIWDQAAIWPLTHVSTGLWADDFLDFSQINLLQPATDLSWIGIK